MEPEILFEDDSLYVIYKPAGLAVESAKPDQMDLYSYLKNRRQSEGTDDYVAVINRLDQPVEGLVLCAKTKASAEILSKEIRDYNIRKSYLAIITRDNIPQAGTLTDFLVKNGRTGRAKAVEETDPRAKKAILNYRIIDRLDNMQLVDVDLVTGRFHQIRCQFAKRSAPLLGDVKYGGHNTGNGIALCAYRLSFKHPVTGDSVTYQVRPKGNDFQEFPYFRNFSNQ